MIYHIFRWVAATYFCLFHRMRVKGRDNIPKTGPVIIAANHASYLDPPIIGVAAWRREVRFLARDSLYSNPFIKWFYLKLKTIPMSRERGDVAALKAGLKVLKNNQIIGLYPEGTRTQDGELQEAKGGIGFLIAKAKAPVVPTFIDGNFNAFPRGASCPKPTKITVYFGEAIHPEELEQWSGSKDGFQKIGDHVMSKIEDLKDSISSKN